MVGHGEVVLVRTLLTPPPPKSPHGAVVFLFKSVPVQSIVVTSILRVILYRIVFADVDECQLGTDS